MELIHYHFETLVSTNDWAKSHLNTFDKDCLTLVTAEEQTRGRGQYGREWISPKGQNLCASFCFFLNEEKYDSFLLIRQLALSVVHVLETKGVVCEIKWPNDLLVNGKKIAGILSETESFSPFLGVVMGLGLNINMEEEDLTKIDQPATSLYHETKRKWDVHLILEEIQNQFLFTRE